MVLEAPRTEVRGGSIDGAARGVDIKTATSVSGLRITNVDQGVVIASTGTARLVELHVDARNQSLRVEPGGMVEVEGSRLFPLPTKCLRREVVGCHWPEWRRSPSACPSRSSDRGENGRMCRRGPGSHLESRLNDPRTLG